MPDVVCGLCCPADQAIHAAADLERGCCQALERFPFVGQPFARALSRQTGHSASISLTQAKHSYVSIQDNVCLRVSLLLFCGRCSRCRANDARACSGMAMRHLLIPIGLCLFSHLARASHGYYTCLPHVVDTQGLPLSKQQEGYLPD